MSDQPHDYAREIDDARRHAHIPVWDSHRNGCSWSDVPDRAELGGEK